VTASRAVFDDLLAGRTGVRPAWIPLLETLAARLAGTDHDGLGADAGLWSAGLLQAGELLGADALVVGAHWLPAARVRAAPSPAGGDAPPGEADLSAPRADAQAGTRQAMAAETVRRLGASARRQFGIVAALAGPMAFAARCCPDAPAEEAWPQVRAAHAALAEAALKARPDVLMLFESLDGVPAPLPRLWRRAHATLGKLAGYYDVPVALYVQAGAPAAVAALGELGLPLYLLGLTDEAGVMEAACQLAGNGAAVAVPLPVASGPRARATLEAVLEARRAGARLCLTTAGPVAADEDLTALRTVAMDLRATAA